MLLSQIAPNKGFLQQLDVYEQMGCVVNLNSAVYKAWLQQIDTPTAMAAELAAKEHASFARSRPTAEGAAAVMQRRLDAVNQWNAKNTSA